MSLRPYKFIVQAVVQNIDDEGSVTGESPSEPVQLFGCDALAEWAKAFPDKLAEIEAK